MVSPPAENSLRDWLQNATPATVLLCPTSSLHAPLCNALGAEVDMRNQCTPLQAFKVQVIRFKSRYSLHANH